MSYKTVIHILRVSIFTVSCLSIALPSFLCAGPSDLIKTPESYFGFRPGTDRMLFDYEQLIGYFQEMDRASPMLKLVEAGDTPLGKKIYIVFISAAKNIEQLDRLKDINHRLTFDPDIPEPEREALFEEGKVFVLATLSMHSGEVGPTQSAPILAYDLVTSEDKDVLNSLENMVYMMVPCHNPDGMDMIVEHYRKYKGTPYERSSMPGLYHKYVGHDNNRDFIILTQEDTKAVAGIYNTEWLPQVHVEKHQMGATGPRYFVPPPHDPIAENLDEGIWSWVGVFGSNLQKDMTSKGLTGVSQHYLFDEYWPGPTGTSLWKNVISFLTEAASVRYATPIFVEPNELRVYGKGLAEYKKSINMPVPWPGGWWKLGDIVKYEITSAMSIIKTASLYRREILEFRNDLCRKQVRLGRTTPPFYYVLPREQRDESELVGLVTLLQEHGVKVYRLSSVISVDDNHFREGDIVIPLSQPYRAFVKEVMEKQEYPVRHYTPDGDIIKPYDITSWSLPLQRGLRAVEVNERSGDLESRLEMIHGTFDLMGSKPDTFGAVIFPVRRNESFKAAFLAMESGLNVSRLVGPANVSGAGIAKGSFVIRNGSGMQAKLDRVISEMTVQPIFVNDPSVLHTEPLSVPRIALVESYFHDMDAGWTRFIFDTYYIPYEVIRPGDFEKTDFTRKYDVVIFPNENKSILMKGKRKSREDDDTYTISSYPPEYTKGIGDKGMEKLMTFVDGGGIIVAWGRSTDLFTKTLTITRSKEEKEEFKLPVRNVAAKLKKSGLYCPGSIVRTLLLEDHPLTLGAPEELGVFFTGEPVFTTSLPRFDMDRRVIGRYPEKDILQSGYCENEEQLGNKISLVWMRKGKGQFVLFGFNPQFRASTAATYKLVFNAVLMPGLD